MASSFLAPASFLLKTSRSEDAAVIFIQSCLVTAWRLKYLLTQHVLYMNLIALFTYVLEVLSFQTNRPVQIPALPLPIYILKKLLDIYILLSFFFFFSVNWVNQTLGIFL